MKDRVKFRARLNVGYCTSPAMGRQRGSYVTAAAAHTAANRPAAAVVFPASTASAIHTAASGATAASLTLAMASVADTGAYYLAVRECQLSK